MDNSVENYLRAELMEAVRLLDRQRYRVQYKMDDQLKTEKEVARFIERWK